MIKTKHKLNISIAEIQIRHNNKRLISTVGNDMRIHFLDYLLI